MANTTRKVLYPLSVLGCVVRRADRGTILSRIVTCVFFFLYYLYIRQCLDPRLLYHANELALPSGRLINFPIFLQGTAFLKEFLARPGGLAEYAAAWCSQYYYYPHLGPLILTAVAWLLYLCSDWLIRVGGGRGSRSLRFAPPLLLLITYNQYTFDLQNYVALIAALIPTTFYVFVASRVDKAAGKLLLFTIASVALYYAAGGSYILFAVLCALFELLAGRRYFLGGLYLLAAAVIPLLGRYFFRIPLKDAYLRPVGVFPFGETLKATALSALYLFFVLVAVVLPFRRGLARLASAVSSRTGKLGRYCLNEKLKIVYAVLVLVIASASVALYTLEKDARRVLRANYLARMERWEDLLEEVDRHSSQGYPATVMLDVNRALFETDRLGSGMFSYPQHPSVLFEIGARSVSFKGGPGVLLGLGRINEAEHAALGALEMKGERPETLRQLAIIYIVKRQPEAARVFLGVLSRDIVHGQWARDCLHRLDEDPLLSSDRQIQHLRSVMPLCDMVVTSTKSKDASKSTDMKEAILLALLARNRKNRMAFEYLMAHYLLARRPEKIACSIGRLDDFDYPAVPEHYAEAILLYGNRIGRRIDVAGRTIDEHTRERVRKMIQIVRDFGGDKEAMAEVLEGRFPNSYCRYLLTGRSGGAR